MPAQMDCRACATSPTSFSACPMTMRRGRFAWMPKKGRPTASEMSICRVKDDLPTPDCETRRKEPPLQSQRLPTRQVGSLSRSKARRVERGISSAVSRVAVRPLAALREPSVKATRASGSAPSSLAWASRRDAVRLIWRSAALRLMRSAQPGLSRDAPTAVVSSEM